MVGPFWQEVRADLVAFLGTDLVKAGASQLWNFFRNSVTPMDMKFFRLRMTGQLPLEDENLVERAKAQLTAGANPNIVTLAEQKLAMIKSHEQDYVRLVVVGFADPDKSKDENDKARIEGIQQVYTMFAGFTTKQWKRHIKIMNYRREAAKAEEKFKIFKQIVGGITGIPKGANDALKKSGLSRGAKKAHDSFARWMKANV